MPDDLQNPLTRPATLSMNRWHDRQVLECGSPLPLWRSWVIESARGLAQSKTLTRHWGRFMAPMRVRSRRSRLPMNRQVGRALRARRALRIGTFCFNPDGAHGVTRPTIALGSGVQGAKSCFAAFSPIGWGGAGGSVAGSHARWYSAPPCGLSFFCVRVGCAATYRERRPS
jgi:hypothetical protein